MLSEKQFFPTTISSLLKTIANTLQDTFTIILYASDLEYMVDCDNLFGVSDSDDVSDSEFFCQWQPRAIDSVIEEMVETVGGGKLYCKVLHGLRYTNLEHNLNFMY